MTEDFSHESHVVRTEHGVTLDPWAKKTRPELKRRCGQLSRALGQWQRIAMVMAEGGKDSLPPEWRKELDDLIAAYKD